MEWRNNVAILGLWKSNTKQYMTSWNRETMLPFWASGVKHKVTHVEQLTYMYFYSLLFIESGALYHWTIPAPYIHTHTYISISIYIYTHTHTYIYIYPYIYIYIHTHTHSGHFCSAVSHRQGWTHRALHVKYKINNNVYIKKIVLILYSSHTCKQQSLGNGCWDNKWAQSHACLL